jgi:hypothetical protein
MWGLDEIQHKVEYLPGPKNKMADALSRRSYMREMLFELPTDFDELRNDIYEDYITRSGDTDSAQTQLEVDVVGTSHISKLSRVEKLEYRTQKNSLPPLRREGLAAMTLRGHNIESETQPETQPSEAETPEEVTKTRPIVPKRSRGRPRKIPIIEVSNVEDDVENSGSKSLNAETETLTNCPPSTPQQFDPTPETPPRIPWVMNAPSWCQRMTDNRPIPPKNSNPLNQVFHQNKLSQ